MFECVKVYQEHSPFWTIWMKSIFFIRCLMFDLYYPSLDIQKRERERGTIIKNIWTFVNHLFLPFFLTLSLIVINNNSKKKLNLLIVIQSFYVSGNLNLMMIMMKNKKKLFLDLMEKFFLFFVCSRFQERSRTDPERENENDEALLHQ